MALLLLMLKFEVGFEPERGPGGKEASGGSFGARATAVKTKRSTDF